MTFPGHLPFRDYAACTVQTGMKILRANTSTGCVSAWGGSSAVYGVQGVAVTNFFDFSSLSLRSVSDGRL